MLLTRFDLSEIFERDFAEELKELKGGVKRLKLWLG